MVYPSDHDREQHDRSLMEVTVELARRVLEMFDLKLTTLRKDKWHLLSQVFADTECDLRHHLDASLAEKS